jgi:hypothetical protein
MLIGCQQSVCPARVRHVRRQHNKGYHQREGIVLNRGVYKRPGITGTVGATYQGNGPHQHVQSTKLYTSQFFQLFSCKVVKCRVLSNYRGERKIRYHCGTVM